MNALQAQPVKPVIPKPETENTTTLRLARVKRLIQEGTYYVPGHQIALKLMQQEQQLFPIQSAKACIPWALANGNNSNIINAKTAR